MHLALNKLTNDLFFRPESGGVARVSDGRFVVQQVSCKLKTILGEWLLDDSIGYLQISDFEKGFDRFELSRRLSDIVIKTQGVLSVDSVDLDYDDRSLSINFTATTIYGKIDTSVPWDDEVIADPEDLPEFVEAVTYFGVPVTVGGVLLTHTITI